MKPTDLLSLLATTHRLAIAQITIICAFVLLTSFVHAEDSPWKIVDLGTDRTFVSAADTETGPSVLTMDWEGTKPPKTLMRRILTIGKGSTLKETIWKPNVTLEQLYTADNSVARIPLNQVTTEGAIFGIADCSIGGHGVGRAFVIEQEGQQWLPKFPEEFSPDPTVRGLSASRLIKVHSSVSAVGTWKLIKGDGSDLIWPVIWQKKDGQWICFPLFRSDAESQRWPKLKITSMVGVDTIAGSYVNEQGNTVPVIAYQFGVPSVPLGIAPYEFRPMPLEVGSEYKFTTGEITAATTLVDPVYAGVASLGDNEKTRHVIVWKQAAGEFRGKIIDLQDAVPDNVVGWVVGLLIVNTKGNRIAVSGPSGLSYLDVPGYTDAVAVATVNGGVVLYATKAGKKHLIVASW